jgi:hypothetical protein
MTQKEPMMSVDEAVLKCKGNLHGVEKAKFER